eukprot:CAMPEP_0173409222 /NCGR_PEP_ID=MMETSP1356-20130122/71630_1 /TAXON_ID=77927 ORGANISM="Hemiselmis virescens, Strain PCC157" /NCGR_SAMPLE_ID=MMETSP1356 /ASSEMBLY_ACC=CAM_ASM_000847 /LENGTH=108 /DNA_ID=CAMNT_0014370653 /DNA_START=142 /DNA_END=465 /DNA_ORIENTATION=-
MAPRSKPKQMATVPGSRVQGRGEDDWYRVEEFHHDGTTFFKGGIFNVDDHRECVLQKVLQFAVEEKQVGSSTQRILKTPWPIKGNANVPKDAECMAWQADRRGGATGR